MQISVLKSGNRIVVDSQEELLVKQLLEETTFQAKEYQHANAVKARIRKLEQDYHYASNREAPDIKSKIDEEKRFLTSPIKLVDYRCSGTDLKGRFATSWGFYARVCRLLRDKGFEPKLKDLRPDPDPSVFEPQWEQFFRRFSDMGYELRADQERFLEIIFSRRQGRMDLPTGFGKTFMLGVLGLLLPKAKIHITTKRASILEQRIYPELAGMLPSVGLVKAGKKDYGQRVMCYSAGSLHHSDGEADYLFLDECVTGDAIIETVNGPVRLDEIVLGSEVVCFDKGVVACREVLNVWSKGCKPVLRLTFSSGKQIKCTEDHLLRTPDAWVEAHKLTINESVISLERKTEVNVLSACPTVWRTSEESLVKIEKLPPENVYDIEVAGCHNFFANGLLVHNCHELATDTLAPKLGKYLYSRNYGLSATNDMRADNKDFRIEAACGPIVMVRSNQHAVNAGIISPIKVRWRNVEMLDNPCENVSGLVNRNRSGIWRNTYRNKLIAEDARKFDKETQVLVTTSTIDHALHLKKLLPEYTVVYAAAGLDPNKRRSYVDAGLIDPDEPIMDAARVENVTREFTRHRLLKVICTTIWNVGVDFRDLRVLIRADGEGSSIKNVQIPGRLSRLADKTDKKSGLVIDYLDQFDPGFKIKATARFKSYKSLGFKQTLPGDKKSPEQGEKITKHNCHRKGKGVR